MLHVGNCQKTKYEKKWPQRKQQQTIATGETKKIDKVASKFMRPWRAICSAQLFGTNSRLL